MISLKSAQKQLFFSWFTEARCKKKKKIHSGNRMCVNIYIYIFLSKSSSPAICSTRCGMSRQPGDLAAPAQNRSGPCLSLPLRPQLPQPFRSLYSPAEARLRRTLSRAPRRPPLHWLSLLWVASHHLPSVFAPESRHYLNSPYSGPGTWRAVSSWEKAGPGARALSHSEGQREQRQQRATRLPLRALPALMVTCKPSLHCGPVSPQASLVSVATRVTMGRLVLASSGCVDSRQFQTFLFFPRHGTSPPTRMTLKTSLLWPEELLSRQHGAALANL